MPIDSLLGTGGAFMQNLLNLRQKRQEIIGANVANADTPGYKAKRLEFEDALKEAMPVPGKLPMMRTSAQHLPVPFEDISGNLQPVESVIPKGDKNSVDLESEMARQAANQLLYNYAAQSMASQISKLRNVIQEGN